MMKIVGIVMAISIKCSTGYKYEINIAQWQKARFWYFMEVKIVDSQEIRVEMVWILKTKCMRNCSYGLAVEFKYFTDQYFMFFNVSFQV